MVGRFDYTRYNFCSSCGSNDPKPKTMLKCEIHHTRLRTKARWKGGRSKENAVQRIDLKGNSDGSFNVKVTRRYETEPTKRVEARSVLAAVRRGVTK